MKIGGGNVVWVGEEDEVEGSGEARAGLEAVEKGLVGCDFVLHVGGCGGEEMLACLSEDGAGLLDRLPVLVGGAVCDEHALRARPEPAVVLRVGLKNPPLPVDPLHALTYFDRVFLLT